MPLLRRFLVVPLLLLALALLACNDNGGHDVTARPNTPETSETPADGASPTGGFDDTPTQPPASAEPSVTPGESPAAQGTPAVGPVDPSQYISQDFTQEDCQYNPGADIADCSGRGAFILNPPFLGEDISCSVFIVQGNPVLLLCRSQQPQQATYYAIQG